jgi:hypothetical protein
MESQRDGKKQKKKKKLAAWKTNAETLTVGNHQTDREIAPIAI